MKVCSEWFRLSKEQKDIISQHHDSFPVKVGSIAKAFGIQVKRSTLSPGISGEIKETNGEVIVKINRHDSEERQRFTLAHEIAHFLLHRDKIGDGIVDTMLFRSSLSNSLEAEANRLAADIVMPFSLIDSEPLSSNLRFEERVEYLANLSKLSIPAMEIRLGKKGF
ncbi:ImmA/IrrE family metallo-endopeptidase [Pseudoalteromonas sp. NC201]|uniref:ImmA/IrrE family metallo-endopeptidase n=1 Tax=Pseudoalteromonas sp. NC201 TaxID=1514074 RepID=UPI000C7D420A|nr:ImmA/IrrE family metallo-endopeptidase [Pseudoalteromonas sp. NC201]AUJ71392.1 hypothetical protein PNC201_15800 [Pseudoalteromonas sp. NC201]